LAASAPRTSRIYSSSSYAGSEFEAREVPAEWHQQLMAVGAEGLAEEEGGGGGPNAEEAAAEAVRARERCEQLLMTE
jgi:hypothetical protein